MPTAFPPILEEILHYTFLGNTVDTWLKGLGILFVFIILRYRLVQIFLAGFKRLTQKTATTLDDRFVEVIERPVRWGVLLLGLYISLRVLDFSRSTEMIISNLLRSFIIILSVWIAYRIISVFSESLQKLSRHFQSELSESLIKLVISILKAFIIAVGIITVFQEWGFNVNGFLASLGLVGMALALAAKDTASNFFGSIMIFTDHPFKVGDWVQTPDVEGVIEDIGIRSTKVRTFAQALVTVPNANLANKAITNWSRMGKRRIKMTLGLTYSTTSEQMEKILYDIRELIANDEETHDDFYVYFTDYHESSLGIFLYFFTRTTNWGEFMRVKEKFNLEFMKIVESHGASFAFPSRSLYLESMPDSGSAD